MKRQQGSLLLVYGALMGFGILASAAVTSAFYGHRATERMAHQAQAFYLAEAGLDQALVALRDDPDYAGTTYVVVLGEEGEPVGGYDVTVEEMEGDRRHITVVGHYPTDDAATPWYASAVVEGTVRFSGFSPAVFAQEEVLITGAGLVDSYDSGDGAYGGSNVGSHGDIGTNGTGPGAVTITGNGMVQGDAWVGPGADVASAVTMQGSGEMTGSSNAMSEQKAMAPVEMPGGMPDLGDLHLTGNQAVSMAGGAYQMGDLELTGYSKLTFSSPTTLYVTGQILLTGGGEMSASDLPANLTIYMMGGGSVTFTGGSQFHGTVYAPESSVIVTGGSDVFGAATGKEVTVTGGGGVHYDEALSSSESSGLTLDMWMNTLSDA